MNLNKEELKKQHIDNGFFVIKNFLNINPDILLTDIFSADCTVRYNDNYSNLRRIEKIYDKSESLSNLNNLINNNPEILSSSKY